MSFVNPLAIHLHFYFKRQTIITFTKPRKTIVRQCPLWGELKLSCYIYPTISHLSGFSVQSEILARAVTFVFVACQLWPEIRFSVYPHLDKWIRCSSERKINVTHLTIKNKSGPAYLLVGVKSYHQHFWVLYTLLSFKWGLFHPAICIYTLRWNYYHSTLWNMYLLSTSYLLLWETIQPVWP